MIWCARLLRMDRNCCETEFAETRIRTPISKYPRRVLETRKSDLEYGPSGVCDLLAQAESLADQLQRTVKELKDTKQKIRDIDEVLERL